VYWQSRVYNKGTTAGNAWRNQQGAYALADLIVGWQPTPQLDVQLNVSNLFDKVYYQRVWAAYGSNYYGEPRSVMLNVRAKY
jgi:outer membrane receptor for ferric coprogen and ferric-rhodotorulic acid